MKSSNVLTVNNLSKKYGKNHALNDVTFELKRGVIHGLIGENGSGKTTLLKLITKIILPTGGSFEIMTSYENNVYNSVGALIDTPSYYGDMTAYDNLEIQMLNAQIKKPDKAAILEILKLVDLEDTGNKKLKNFSLGMKQKLGIGLALVNEPDFLILDEPINGLDPVSIVEVRNLLIKLNKNRGITILISSHILEELHKVADNFIFIDKGRLIKNISRIDISKEIEEKIILKVNNVSLAKKILNENLQIKDVEVSSNDELIILEKINDLENFSKTLLKKALL